MCPTADDRNIFDSAVCLVAVCMQITVELFQKALSIFRLAVRLIIIEHDLIFSTSARPVQPHVALGRCRLFLCPQNPQGRFVRVENAFFKEQLFHFLIQRLQPEL